MIFSVLAGHISLQAGVTLVSNSANSQSEEDTFFSGYSLFQSFHTGSESATIDGIQLQFGYLGNASGIGVSVYSDFGGQVGNLLSSFTPMGPPGMMMYQTFGFAGSLNVNANSNYWIVLSATGGTDLYGNSMPSSWNYAALTSSGAEVGLAGWTLANSHYQGSASSPTEYSGNPIKVSITGSVPEPSTASLLLLGIGGWFSFNRRRRSLNVV